MKTNSRSIFQRFPDAVEHMNTNRQQLRGNQVAFGGKFMPASDFAKPHAGQVDRGALAAMDFFAARVMVLNAADTNRQVAGLNFHRITDAQRSATDTSCDDGAVSFDRKRAVDRHSKRSRLAVCDLGCRHLVCRITECFLQFIDPESGFGTGANNRSVVQKCIGNGRSDFLFDHFQP